MTQDERWMVKYQEVMEFMEKEHRNPSRYIVEGREVKKFEKLQDIAEKYRRVNMFQ